MVNLDKLKEPLLSCKQGNHNLIVIYSHNASFAEEPTVRWCTKCGSVVVDSDKDGRIYPGRIKKMIGPALYLSVKDEI